jgi:hypothetical protein
LEIAPTKVFNSLSNIAESEILSFLVNLKNKGIAPVAMQALLF